MSFSALTSSASMTAVVICSRAYSECGDPEPSMDSGMRT
jgi:hypothetical protein